MAVAAPLPNLSLKPGVREGTSLGLDVDEGAGPARPDGGRVLCCAACRRPITSSAQRRRVQGEHRHTFTNPYGYVYRIGCFAEAPGCLAHPSDSGEFTWFAGYRWRIVVCSGCGLHLGWGFANDGDRFVGLILDRLVEEPTQAPS